MQDDLTESISDGVFTEAAYARIVAQIPLDQERLSENYTIEARDILEKTFGLESTTDLVAELLIRADLKRIALDHVRRVRRMQGNGEGTCVVANRLRAIEEAVRTLEGALHRAIQLSTGEAEFREALIGRVKHVRPLRDPMSFLVHLSKWLRGTAANAVDAHRAECPTCSIPPPPSHESRPAKRRTGRPEARAVVETLASLLSLFERVSKRTPTITRDGNLPREGFGAFVWTFFLEINNVYPDCPRPSVSRLQDLLREIRRRPADRN
ncbi:MAG TPA: hypothetical protein VGK20_11610 [Candidatus Binatia bacterium]